MGRYDSPTPPERPKRSRGRTELQHNPNSTGATDVPGPALDASGATRSHRHLAILMLAKKIMDRLFWQIEA